MCSFMDWKIKSCYSSIGVNYWSADFTEEVSVMFCQQKSNKVVDHLEVCCYPEANTETECSVLNVLTFILLCNVSTAFFRMLCFQVKAGNSDSCWDCSKSPDVKMCQERKWSSVPTSNFCRQCSVSVVYNLLFLTWSGQKKESLVFTNKPFIPLLFISSVFRALYI